VVLAGGMRVLVFAKVVAEKVGTVMKRCVEMTGGGDVCSEVRVDSSFDVL